MTHNASPVHPPNVDSPLPNCPAVNPGEEHQELIQCETIDKGLMIFSDQ